MNNGTCYMCLEEECETNRFKYPLPCLCKGTTMIHRKCFIEVRKTMDKCPNCKSKYISDVFTIDCPSDMKIIREKMGNSGFIHEYVVNNKGVKNGQSQLVLEGLYMSHECTYKDGKLHGKYTKYYPSGYINYTSDYVNGDKHGIEMIYYVENDQVHKEIEYKNNNKNGIYHEYSKDGRLLLEYNVIGDKRHGRYRSWHERSGTLTIDLYYNNNQYHGPYKRYNNSGIIEIDTVYVNHKYNGHYRSYYPTGQLECECEYVNGLLNGEYKSYKMNGEVHATALYGRTLIA